MCIRDRYRALGCTGYARLDMFLTPEGQIVFNEINTIPGLSLIHISAADGRCLPLRVSRLCCNSSSRKD